jgi:hypothetical protein
MTARDHLANLLHPYSPVRRESALNAYRDEVLQTLNEATEPLRVRLWLIEQYVARITASDDPVAIGLDLTPYLDGPIHPDHVAAYHAACISTALEG